MHEVESSSAGLGAVDVLESLTDAFVALDRDWRITYVNAAAERTNGTSREQLLGKTHWEAFPSVRETEFEYALRKAMAERVAIRGESFYAPYGRWFEMDIHPIQNGGLAFYGRDITERKLIEEKLRHSEALLAEAQKLAGVGSWNWDATGTIEWSDEQYRIFGLTPQQVDMTRERVLSCIHPDDRAAVDRVGTQAWLDHQPFEHCMRAVHADGTVRIVHSRGQVAVDERGKAVRMFGTVQDITERIQAEEVQRRLQVERDEVLARLQLQFERMPIACAVFDPQWRVIEWNPAAETTFGYGRDEVIGRTGPLFLVPPALRTQLQAIHDRLAAGDMSAHSVNENLTKDGRTIICDWRNTPLRDAAGEVIGILSMAQDITERVRAQEELSQVNRRLELALQGSDIGVWELELSDGKFETGRVVYSNAREQLGYGRAESTPDLADGISLIHPEDRESLPNAYRSYLAGETDLLEFEHRLRHQDGSYRTMLVRGIAIRDAAGKPTRVIGSRVDITERKRAEEALRWSEERYRSLISKVRDFAIFSTDELGVVTTWNEGCQDVLGYGPEEFVGLDSAKLFTPQDRAEGVPVAERRQSMQGGTAVIDRWMIAKGGRRFFAMGATAPLRDPADIVIGFSYVVRDVTPMKESQDRLTQRGESLERMVSERTGELEEAAERLRISERMAALGTLAAGLGHDMGNLLLPMDVRLSLLIEANLPRELHEHVVGIQKCARYLQRLSGGLRLLATDPAHVESRGVTELGRWWNDVRIVLKDVLPGGIRFEHHVSEPESWVGMGRAGLTQAVYNLVQNAADALKEHGGSRVSVSVESDPSDPWITIRVADDGPGMTEEVARRCMEPYFSTKARGESTGMGLSLVHALVTGAGGQVEIHSAPGQGTTISLTIPRALPREQKQDASPDMAGAV